MCLSVESPPTFDPLTLFQQASRKWYVLRVGVGVRPGVGVLWWEAGDWGHGDAHSLWGLQAAYQQCAAN